MIVSRIIQLSEMVIGYFLSPKFSEKFNSAPFQKTTTKMIYIRPNASCHPCTIIVNVSAGYGKKKFYIFKSKLSVSSFITKICCCICIIIISYIRITTNKKILIVYYHIHELHRYQSYNNYSINYLIFTLQPYYFHPSCL